MITNNKLIQFEYERNFEIRVKYICGWSAYIKTCMLRLVQVWNTFRKTTTVLELVFRLLEEFRLIRNLNRRSDSSDL